MTKKPEKTEIILEKEAKISVDFSNIVKIVVSGFEEELLVRQTSLHKFMTETKQKINRSNDKLDKTLKSLSEDRFKAPALKFIKAANQMSGSQYTASYTGHLTDDDSKVLLSITIREPEGTYNSATSFSDTDKITSKIGALLKEKASHNEFLKAVEEDFKIVRRELQSMNRMERKASAQVAKRVLQDTPEGASLVQELELNFKEGSILTKALPAPK